MHQNRVREMRVKFGLSAAALASRVGISRQTLYLIESHQTNPATTIALKIARELGATVEALFGSDDDQPSVALREVPTTSRVYVATIGDVRVARPALSLDGPPAHGILQSKDRESRVRFLHNDPGRTNDALFLAGCEPTLGLLADYVAPPDGPSSVWLNLSNAASIAELVQGRTHVACVHVSAGEALPSIPAHVPRPIRLVELLSGEMGWLVHPIRGKGFSGATDLWSGHFRLANRPMGSGARALLDEQLSPLGRGEAIPGYREELSSHMEVALAIRLGAAEVGIGPRSVAETSQLRFIPLRVESTWIIVPEVNVPFEALQRLYDALASNRFRRELNAIGSYDTTRTGHKEDYI